MVIEFLGSPGSGKTYLANCLVEFLNENNIKCKNLVDLNRTKIQYKIIFKLVRMYLKINPKTKTQILKIAKNFDCKGYDNLNIGKEIALEFVFYCYLYKKLQNKNNIYLLDEGIEQQIATLMTFYSLTENEIQYLHSFIDFKQNIIVINVDLNDNIESIKQRNRHVCSIDEYKGEKLKKFLIEYQNSVNYLTRRKDCLIIYRNDLLKNNINKICARYSLL